MKKFFTFMAVAAMALSASAEVIYSWQSEGPDAVQQVGGTATAYVDEARVNYANTCDGVTYYTICLSGKKGTYPESAYVNITLDQALAEGDVISVTAYRNKNESGKNATIEFLFDGSLDNTMASTEQFANINPDGEADAAPSTQTFVVPASAAGCKFFDMTRGSASTNIFITKLEITREGEGEPSADALMSWDFTKWSDATVANLKAGENWSDIEKADATEPTEKSKDNCFWQVSREAGLTAEGYLTANDVVIEELKGLVYTNEKANRSLAIAVNYPDPNPASDFGPYHGPAYLWLGSKQINYFVIPGVPAGATIKMGVESHKLTDPRGVVLSVGGETLNAPDGSAVEAPTTYTEQEWLVPESAGESNDVQIYNTNGCHIYFITVTAGSGTSAIQTVATDENAPVEYYNIQGVRVNNPENGLYIKRQGNNVQKIYIK
ncbi:MAG: hypothetical protein K2K37_01680 [Muribaculaceae bacterium]|nr:hypothetical protein [Muribaculaceae bacterium]